MQKVKNCLLLAVTLVACSKTEYSAPQTGTEPSKVQVTAYVTGETKGQSVTLTGNIEGIPFEVITGTSEAKTEVMAIRVPESGFGAFKIEVRAKNAGTISVRVYANDLPALGYGSGCPGFEYIREGKDLNLR